MKQTKQILIAFLVPFLTAIGLALLGDYLFRQNCPHPMTIDGDKFCFSDYYETSFTEMVFVFLVFGLFLTALILPPFLSRRAYQNKRRQMQSKSIFK